jgi:hypothetical protein
MSNLFKYCECGCHGTELQVGGVYMWIKTVLKTPEGGPHYIYQTHGRYGKPIICDTFEEVKQHALTKLKEAKEKIDKAIIDLQPVISYEI